MALADDLLGLSEELAANPGKFAQAKFRRAISTAYYALFNAILDDFVVLVAPGQKPALQNKLRRSVDHKDVIRICGKIEGKANSVLEIQPDQLSGAQQLIVVARTFEELKEARQIADYDMSGVLLPDDVLPLIAKARNAIQTWRAVAPSQEAIEFLFELMLKSRK
jgi:hypothetical protein